MANTGGYFPKNISPPISPIPLIDTENKMIFLNTDSNPNELNAKFLMRNENNSISMDICNSGINPAIKSNYGTAYCNDLKRKRYDDVGHSIISDSILSAPGNSAKKSKLFRSGSISRTLKRSISFVGVQQPFLSKIQIRRNSIDPNSSINSISSFDTTINIAGKNKFKSFRSSLTPKKRMESAEYIGFKTPKAPKSKIFSVIKNNLFLPSPTLGDGSDCYSDHTVNLNSTPINANISSNNITLHQHMSSINECDISLSHLIEGNLNTVHIFYLLF